MKKLFTAIMFIFLFLFMKIHLLITTVQYYSQAHFLDLPKQTMATSSICRNKLLQTDKTSLHTNLNCLKKNLPEIEY